MIFHMGGIGVPCCGQTHMKSDWPKSGFGWPKIRVWHISRPSFTRKFTRSSTPFLVFHQPNMSSLYPHYHTVCLIIIPFVPFYHHVFLIIDPLKEKTPPPWSSRKCLHAVFFLWTGSFPCPIVGAGGAQFDFRDVSHLQPLAATCPVSHLQPLGSHLADTCSSGCQVAASGCKWLTGQVAASGCQVASSGCKWLQVADGASGCKWLTGQVAASGLPSGCKWLQVAASGCQVAASGCKWLTGQVAASGCQVAASGCQVAAKCYLEKKVILEILLFFKIAASGCQVAAKWLAGQVAAKWLTGQVRAGTI